MIKMKWFVFNVLIIILCILFNVIFASRFFQKAFANTHLFEYLLIVIKNFYVIRLNSIIITTKIPNEIFCTNFVKVR